MIRSNTDVTLVCPETRLSLFETDLADAEKLVAAGNRLWPRLNEIPRPVGPTPRVMVREDHGCAYPILDGVPVLLGPEMLVAEEAARAIDLTDPRYDEAYREMEHYNAVAFEDALRVESSSLAKYLKPVRQLDACARSNFPEPRTAWLHTSHDASAEWDAYQYLGSLSGKKILQLGGRGLHAVKFLMAGCEEAWLIAPMVGELYFARKLAELMGVADRLRCAAGVGEAIPVSDASFDVVYSGGCVHHMRTEIAMPEVARVLTPGGKFVAVEPWRAPLYSIGTRVFGKRESSFLGKRDIGVYCRPMTKVRVDPLYECFNLADVVHHGALFRYPLLALSKLGLKLSNGTIWNINAVDDRLCSFLPKIRDWGSIVAILGTRGPERPAANGRITSNRRAQPAPSRGNS